jgi:hypothetical protein
LEITLIVYPQYNDLLNGFTYNGHAYIAAFVLLSIAISFGFISCFLRKAINEPLYCTTIFMDRYQRYHSP